MKTVTVYSTNYCPYCNAAKKFLSHKGITFTEINVEGDDAKRKWLQETTGMRTVPQIFIGDKSIGGFDDMMELENSGELDSLLK